MEKPTLLILAAGMGSRYGGLKQMDAVGPSGEIVMDYSIHDAVRAEFLRVCHINPKTGLRAGADDNRRAVQILYNSGIQRIHDARHNGSDNHIRELLRVAAALGKKRPDPDAELVRSPLHLRRHAEGFQKFLPFKNSERNVRIAYIDS